MQRRYIFSMKKTGKFRKDPSTHEHTVAFPKMVRSVIETSDIVLEVLDARFLDKTRNIEMENFVRAKGKKLVYIINKIDLVNVAELKAKHDMSKLQPYVFFSSKSKVGRARLRQVIKIEMRKMRAERMKTETAKVISERAQGRVGVIGYPNTGKSTIINILSGRKGTGTSSEAGFTRAYQKIRFNKDIVILDTPGVFLEKENPFDDTAVVKKHAIIGIMAYDKVKEPDMIVSELMKQNPGIFEAFYGVEANGDSEILIEEFGRRKKLIKKGNQVDVMRAAREILKDWQQGNICKNQD